MDQINKILQELNDLGSNLANHSRQNVYEVPPGYFDGLADHLIRQIKAETAHTAKEELAYLSPLLSSLSKENPYSVADNYFDSLEENLREINRGNTRHQTPGEELHTLSPLLSGLDKKTLYSVPHGYFENLGTTMGETIKTESKVISLSKRRSWMRFAAAAIVTGIIVLGGVLYYNRSVQIDPLEQPHAWLQKNVKKVSTTEIDSFIKLTEQESVAVNTNGKVIEIKELMKDVPDSEIQEFLSETSDSEENSDEAMLN